MTLRKCIAIKAPLAQLLLLSVLLFAAALAEAAGVAGMVANLSGPLLAKKADGSVKVLSVKSEVESGDTLVTEKNTYARIRFIDNSEITLRPDSQVKIDSFSYDEAKPEQDSATFNLIKGGLRAITGALGKRNHERVGVNTPTATIGIRGTTFIAQYVPPPASASARPNDNTQADLVRELLSSTLPTQDGQASTGKVGNPVPLTPPNAGQVPVGKAGNGAPPAPPPLAPGLHLSVSDGAIIVTNNGGSLGFQAGQFGYVPSVNQPPVIVPSNPNIQFVPPPSFNAGNAGAPGSSGQNEAVDCVVR
jgi:hypothetical protein